MYLQLLLMYWSVQLLRILKREQRNWKSKPRTTTTISSKKQERQNLLQNEGLSSTLQTSGIIKQSKSVENLQSSGPLPPIRSSSR